MELENQLKSHKERLDRLEKEAKGNSEAIAILIEQNAKQGIRLDRLEKTLEISKIRIIALMRATGTELPPEDYDRIVEIRRRKEGEG
jgi:predicted nuclease with TOPRIM domain